MMHCLHLLERTQHYVVGHEARIVHRFYGIYPHGVYPRGVFARCRSARRYYYVFRKGYVLALLVKFVVAFRVVECIDAIFSRGNAFYHKMSRAVGAPNLFERGFHKCAVVEV